MNEPSSTALINLAAAFLVFFAAIIPLSHGIWRRAKETNSTYKVKIISLSAFSIALYFCGLLWDWYNGTDWIVVVFFWGGFVFYTLLFKAQESPIDRGSILILVLQSMLVVTTLLLYFINSLTISISDLTNSLSG